MERVHPGISGGPSVQTKFLLVEAHSHACAIPLSHVIEIMRPLPLETVAGAPQFVLGLAVIRGAPTPVIGLDALLSGRSETIANRFVTIRTGGRIVSLAVKNVRGIGAIESAALEGLPPLLQSANTNAIETIGSLDAQLLIVLRSSKLLSEEVWQSLAAGKAES